MKTKNCIFKIGNTMTNLNLLLILSRVITKNFVCQSISDILNLIFFFLHLKIITLMKIIFYKTNIFQFDISRASTVSEI